MQDGNRPPSERDHVTDTTIPADQSDAGTEDNWQARYVGLQKVLSTRDAELAAERKRAQEAQDALDAQSTDMTELEEFRQARQAAESEQAERAQYETLKAKFEQAPPTPLKHGGSGDRVWAGADYPAAKARERDAEVGGFPV